MGHKNIAVGILAVGTLVMAFWWWKGLTAIRSGGKESVADGGGNREEGLTREGDNGSAVTVTARLASWPGDGQGSNNFLFELLLNTHAVDLSGFDIQKEIELVETKTSRVLRSTEWQEAEVSTHHRKGLLIFPKSSDAPKSIKLLVNNLAGIGVREFSWDL